MAKWTEGWLNGVTGREREGDRKADSLLFRSEVAHDRDRVRGDIPH